MERTVRHHDQRRRIPYCSAHLMPPSKKVIYAGLSFNESDEIPANSGLEFALSNRLRRRAQHQTARRSRKVGCPWIGPAEIRATDHEEDSLSRYLAISAGAELFGP